MRVPARVGLLCILSMLSFQHPTLGNLIQRPHRGAALRMASEDRTVPASEDRTMPAEQMPANAFVELAVATSATAKFGFFGWLHKQIFGPTPISPNYKCTPGTGWNADDNGKLSSYGTCKALPAMNTEAGKTEEKKDARVHPSSGACTGTCKPTSSIKLDFCAFTDDGGAPAELLAKTELAQKCPDGSTESTHPVAGFLKDVFECGCLAPAGTRCTLQSPFKALVPGPSDATNFLEMSSSAATGLSPLATYGTCTVDTVRHRLHVMERVVAADPRYFADSASCDEPVSQLISSRMTCASFLRPRKRLSHSRTWQQQRHSATTTVTCCLLILLQDQPRFRPAPALIRHKENASSACKKTARLVRQRSFGMQDFSSTMDLRNRFALRKTWEKALLSVRLAVLRFRKLWPLALMDLSN